MIPNFVRNLKDNLQKKLPGRMSQNRMAPLTHNEYAASMDTGTAGVLVLLFPRKGDLFTLLIKRTEYPGPHSGQISLPGGKSDKTDKSQIETALREAREETGIEPENITVLGTLTPLYIPVSNLEVLPVVGYTELQPEFRINKSEVEYLIQVSLQNLISKNTATEKPLKIRDKSIHVPGYLIENEYVWGATAMILSEFIEIAINSGATGQ